ncbi:hypothetical protein F2Q70_00002207 [Brassica cretica]|uniref:Uncharacterized protein n=1 Tax=Brassica cretica TaxID=69181 RepID=A0A8S9J691_BRACR|nr:hypothetical protein F2Q70_00002207 [Brassica cretica]
MKFKSMGSKPGIRWQPGRRSIIAVIFTFSSTYCLSSISSHLIRPITNMVSESRVIYYLCRPFGCELGLLLKLIQIELPSFRSNRSVIEIHVEINSRDYENDEISLKIPLHARHQVNYLDLLFRFISLRLFLCLSVQPLQESGHSLDPRPKLDPSSWMSLPESGILQHMFAFSILVARG